MLFWKFNVFQCYKLVIASNLQVASALSNKKLNIYKINKQFER